MDRIRSSKLLVFGAQRALTVESRVVDESLLGFGLSELGGFTQTGKIHPQAAIRCHSLAPPDHLQAEIVVEVVIAEQPHLGAGLAFLQLRGRDLKHSPASVQLADAAATPRSARRCTGSRRPWVAGSHVRCRWIRRWGAPCSPPECGSRNRRPPSRHHPRTAQLEPERERYPCRSSTPAPDT